MIAKPAAPTGAVQGLLAIELTDTPAAAFAAALAADFGATVIVCEPAEGSGLRDLGSPSVRDVWWSILARNKLSLGIDIVHPKAGPVLERLAAHADILFRDDGTDAAEAAEHITRAEELLDVRIYPPGSDRPDLWPWSVRPEFAAAATGMMALTGFSDGDPTQPEIPLADYSAGMMALSLAMAELRQSRLQGRKPRNVELGLHEALHRMNEWHIIVATAHGRAELRNGNRFPMNANIGNIFSTRDGKLLTVSAATPSVADRLLNMIGGADLRDDSRFSTPTARSENMDTLDAVVAEWFSQHDMEEAMRLVQENDVVVGPINDARDLFAHDHITERADITRSRDEIGSGIHMPSVLPFMSPGTGDVRHLGPEAGADTEQVMKMLGFSATEVSALFDAKIIWSQS